MSTKTETESFNSKNISTVTIQDSSSSIHIKLDGSNYRVWSKILEMHIAGRKKMGYINGKKAAPSESDSGFDEWEAEDAQVSVGYFTSDLGMIIWFYPSLGGMEYVVHHLLSVISVMYALLTGEGQIYTYMVLISEATTPAVNMRWYLDAAGMKKSRLYLINGVLMFSSWLVARILLFLYLFYHIWEHYNKVKQIQLFGHCLILVAPSVLAILNLIWFGKIFKGLKKTLAKRH